MKQGVAAVIITGITVLSAVADITVDGLSRTVWASKLPGGPLRVIFLAPYGAHQDSFELMQRFDIAGKVVSVSSPEGGVQEFGIKGHYYPELTRTPEQVLDDVRRALESDWEVVVMSWDPDWSKYPGDIRDSILSSVVSGKALALGDVNRKGFQEDLRSRGLTLEETELGRTRFPFIRANEGAAKIYRCGRGYVVHLYVANDSRIGYLLSGSKFQADFEYSAARVGWFLRQVARPETKPYISSAGFEDGRLVIKTGADSTISGFLLRIAVRRRDTYDEVFSARTEAKPGATISIELPYLPTGEYQAELVALDNDGITLDWDAVRFAIAGRVKIKAIHVENDVLRPGDRVICHLEIEGPEDGLRMRARWFDQWNRMLLETEPMPFSEKLALIAPKGSLSVLNRVEITLSSNNGEEAIGTAEMLMPENIRPTDFYVLYWGGVGESWRQRLYYNALRRKMGADACSNCGTSSGTARAAALSHLRVVPYTTAFHGRKLAEELLNEEWLAKVEREARETARAQRPCNTLAYTLGDENYVNAFDPAGRFSDTPHVWEMFRAYLRKLYPDIKSLNAQWGTNFSDWDAIRFESEREMLGSLDNPSAWTDYRMFISRQFAAAHQRMRLAIQEEHPGAIVGWDGAEQFSSYDGYDWWQLTRGMDLIQVYHSYFMPGVHSNKIFNGEAVDSFRPDAALRGCWMNSADLRYGGQYVPWYLCLKGWNGIWWFHASWPDPVNGACRWDLSLTPVVESMAKAAWEIKRGPATLLAHARKQIDPIAVHYSENNWHASTIESGVANHVNNLGLQAELWMAPALVDHYNGDDEMRQIWGGVSPKGHYAAASKNFYLLLHDLGFQVRTMARQEIEAGELTNSGMKVLILPFVVSLSDAEVERIRSFVKEGGLLIADYRCGLRDLHCRLRETPALDDVFGIKRENLGVRRRRASVAVDYNYDSGAEFESIFHEPIISAGARIWGYHDDGTPAFFVHNYGKGKAVYLNFDLYAYDKMRRQGTERRLRGLFRRLLMDLVALSAPFVPEHKYGHPIGHTEVTRFRDGDTWYFGVLPDYSVNDKSPKAVSLPFPKGMHVYEVRERRYLGDGGMIRDVLEPGQPKMYAALPYKVVGISAKCPKHAKRGELIEIDLKVTGTSEKVGPHAVYVEIVFPDGTRPEYLSRTIYLPDGEGSYSFVPALNAPSGRWKIIVTECVSGKRISVKLDVE
jgi:hypothetical protein